MKKSKLIKLMTVVLSTALVAGSLVGCGDSSSSSSSSKSSTSSSSSSASSSSSSTSTTTEKELVSVPQDDVVKSTKDLPIATIVVKDYGTMEVEFSSDWLYEIEDVEYIEMIIWAYDKAKSSKDFDTGIIKIETNKYTDDISFEQKDNWIDANGLHIVKGDMNDSYISYSIINGNDYFISATLDNCSINDWSFEPGYSVHISNNAVETSIDGWNIIVFPNCIANVVVDISDFMKENDMDKIDNFEFSLNILPNEDYFKEENTDKIVFKNE